jgi:hypothetical protein
MKCNARASNSHVKLSSEPVRPVEFRSIHYAAYPPLPRFELYGERRCLIDTWELLDGSVGVYLLLVILVRYNSSWNTKND